MAGKGLNELGLKDEAMPAQSFDDLPEYGGFAPPPQPGRYRFRMPSAGQIARAWEVFDFTKNGQPAGQRLRLLLDKDAPLTIVQSPGNKVNGDTFQTRLTNAERPRNKEKTIEASDMDYLLKAKGATTRPANNRAYAAEIAKLADQEFNADLTYSYSCSDQKNIRVKGEDGRLQEVENQKGCGKRYYQKDVAELKTAEGEYPHEISCTCGGVLRAFAGLENFGA